jgi:hypothetical protein
VTQIVAIHLNVETGRASGAGTDGSVYLGVCGREFMADTTADDFEAGSSRLYVFGEGATVTNRADNDPRKQRLFEEEVGAFPVYLRFQPRNEADRWNLARAVMTLNGRLLPMWDTASFVAHGEGIWLGAKSGLYVHLPRHRD